MSRPIVYLLPSLGADKRIFQFLNVPSVDFQHIVYPLAEQEESLQAYCHRLIEQIKEPKPILLGASIGGIFSIEISKIIEVEKIILVSSITTYKERPMFFKFAHWMKLYNWVPMPILKEHADKSNIYGTHTPESMRLWADMLKDTDDEFCKWGLKQVCLWKNTEVPKNLIRFHGTKDEIFPFKKIQSSDYVLENAAHFMVAARANEMSELLNNVFTSEKSNSMS